MFFLSATAKRVTMTGLTSAWRPVVVRSCRQALAAILLVASPSAAVAQSSSSETPIYPIWRLMDEQAKRQFIAGYLYGFRDARALGEIAVEFSKQNPPDLAQGLSALLSHYQLTRMRPEQLVPLIDEHLEDTSHHSESLRIIINKIQR